MKDYDLSERIWRGDVSVVEESEDRFIEDPERWLVAHASVLYSFRNYGMNAHELKDLRFRLLAQAATDLAREAPVPEIERVAWADRLETMAAIMQWISEQEDVFETERHDLRTSVFKLCSACIGLTASDITHHTYSLVRLTVARHVLGEGNRWLAEQYLEALAKVAPGVKDPKQRNCVYRGLGELNLRLGRIRHYLSLFILGHSRLRAAERAARGSAQEHRRVPRQCQMSSVIGRGRLEKSSGRPLLFGDSLVRG